MGCNPNTKETVKEQPHGATTAQDGQTAKNTGGQEGEDYKVTKLEFVTEEEFSKQNGEGENKLFILISGKVYDVTKFKHPGGRDVHVRDRMTDKEEPFSKVDAHKNIPQEELDKLYVGPFKKKEVEHDVLVTEHN